MKSDIAKMMWEILNGNKDELLLKSMNDFFEECGLERIIKEKTAVIASDFTNEKLCEIVYHTPLELTALQDASSDNDLLYYTKEEFIDSGGIDYDEEEDDEEEDDEEEIE